MMHRKGQEKHIVEIALALIGFILVGYLIVHFGTTAEESAGPDVCLAALKTQDWLVRSLGRATSSLKPWPSACRTQDVTLDGEMGQDVSKEVIKLMSTCWYEMGSGSFSPFASSLISTPKNCFVCYTFRAPALKEPITDLQFVTYLKELSPAGAEKSFYAIFNSGLQKFLGTRFAQEDIPYLDEDITKERYYALIFIDVEKHGWGQWLESLWRDASPEQRQGASKLHITSVEQARECLEGRGEVVTGD